MNRIDLKHLASYEEDFALWSAEQAALLRAGKLDRIDLENVAEEIESLSKSVKHEIRSRMAVLVAHLLKCQFQPDHLTRSWEATLLEQRMRILDLIEESPSLKHFPETTIAKEYRVARLRASADTELDVSVFPATSPWSIAQILDLDFIPGKTER